MKRIIAMILAICTLLCLTACSSFGDAEKTNKETIKFDLSQYTDNGVLSCGLVWVTKEVSDWDKEVEMQFAYLDADGNIKSPWFSLDTYREAKDFSNGYVVLIERATFEENYDYSNCVVYNTNFQQVARLNCQIPPISGAYITNFDTQGYAYALGYDSSIDDDMLYWIDSSGLHKFEKPDRLSFSSLDEYDLNRFKMSNNHFVIVSGSNDPKYLYTNIAYIYNSNGKLKLDIEGAMRKHIDEFAITSAEVLDDNTVKFYFYGANKKRYVCTMNFNGDFVQSPKEV